MIDSSSIDALTGATVLDTDGDKVGTVNQVYVDETGGQPLFATVHTGLFGTKETFVPLEGASFTGGDLHVGYDKATIKGAPNVDADGAIDDAEQDRIFDYYDGNSSSSSYTAGGGTSTDSTDSTTGAGAGTTSSGATETAGDTSAAAGDYDTIDSGAGTDATTGATGSTGRGADTTGDGYDTSGPTTDDAMTRSEERLKVGTQQTQTGRARLRKHVVTEQQTVTVPVSHDEIHLEREPITDATSDAAYDGPGISEEEHEVVLTEERPVVDKETVPVERVRLAKETVTEQQDVTGDVRKEQIDFDGDGRGDLAENDGAGSR